MPCLVQNDIACSVGRHGVRIHQSLGLLLAQVLGRIIHVVLILVMIMGYVVSGVIILWIHCRIMSYDILVVVGGVLDGVILWVEGRVLGGVVDNLILWVEGRVGGRVVGYDPFSFCQGWPICCLNVGHEIAVGSLKSYPLLTWYVSIGQEISSPVSPYCGAGSEEVIMC